MDRPTRRLRNLKTKLAKKETRSRVTGNKARRWRKEVDKYAPLAQQDETASGDAS